MPAEHVEGDCDDIPSNDEGNPAGECQQRSVARVESDCDAIPNNEEGDPAGECQQRSCNPEGRGGPKTARCEASVMPAGHSRAGRAAPAGQKRARAPGARHIAGGAYHPQDGSFMMTNLGTLSAGLTTGRFQYPL